MRPGRLTVRAFGPYAHEQHVDFDALRDDGLFLIHGATGSGKTFLLDALSFALYGEVSGGRAASALRSDHADPAAEPMAALEFDAEGERWLVERVPPHQRLGLRAASVVDKPARAALSRRVDGSWCPEATGVKEVGLRITELVGLTARQFRQVILLPQGRFEEVLLATSDKREELLKTLFDSVLFESVSLHLDRRARDAAGSLDGTERDLVHLRRQAAERWAEVAGDPDLASAPGPGAAAPTAGTRPSDPTEQPDPEPIDLEVLSARAAARAVDAHQTAGRAEEAAADAARAEASARDLHDRHRRRAQLLAARAELHRAAPVIATQRARLADADAAEVIGPTLDQLAVAEQGRADADSARRRSAERLARAVAAAQAPVPTEVLRLAGHVDHAEVDPSRLAPGIDAARDALTVRKAQIAELAAVADRRRALLRAAEDADHDADVLARGVERARFELAGLAATEQHHREQLRAADAAAAQLDGVEAAAQSLTARARAAVLIAEANADLHRRRHALTEAETARQRAQEQVAAARAAHLDGIAAVLARHLVDGEACLVCGADEHPRPATAAPGAVSAEHVTAAEQDLDAAQRAERAASAALARADAALDARRRDAGPAATDPDRAVLQAQSAIALVQSTADIAATGGEALRQLDALAEHRHALGEQIDTDAPRAASLRRDATNLRAQADHDAERLDDIVAGASLDTAHAEVRDLLAALDALREASVRADHARAALAGAADAFHRHLLISPFADRAEVAGAALDAVRRAALTTQVADHDQRLAAIDAQLALPDLSALGLEPPALGAVQAVAASSRADARAANDHRSRWSAAADAIATIAERHRTLEAAFRADRERAEVLVRVADQCMGRVGDKVSLQRWVLATYLEEICELATIRLQTMTSHRYALRVHRERAARGARSGLDLRVFDAHTGEERTVQSLSGGETFQASLALALAVADSVQQHAGGVHLDALFVDEGFGTLDPHSLELAIDELDRLRAGGRTVGIISHVAALRERIRVGIEVTATPRGSSLRVGDIAAA